MADDKTAEAVDIVAHHFITIAADSVMDREGQEAGYSEFREDDWELVQRRVMEIVDNMKPDPIGFEAAYEYLERRAEQWENESGTQA